MLLPFTEFQAMQTSSLALSLRFCTSGSDTLTDRAAVSGAVGGGGVSNELKKKLSKQHRKVHEGGLHFESVPAPSRSATGCQEDAAPPGPGLHQH